MTEGTGENRLVARAVESGYVALGRGPDESGVNIDSRDEGLVQNLISRATMGATDMNVGLARMLPGQYHIRHHHPQGSEFYYFIKGHCTVHIDGDDIEAGPGTAVYIPRGAVHSIRNDDVAEPVELLYGLSKGDYSDIGLEYDE